jgi:hypothetical protein
MRVYVVAAMAAVLLAGCSYQKGSRSPLSPDAVGAAPAELSAGIDLRQVTYLKGPDVSGWPETGTITEAYVRDGQLCIFHSRLGAWPAGPFFDDPGPIVEGNQWIIVNIDGRWYAGAGDWYRPGQACKSVDANIAHDAFQAEPLASWTPQSGEVFGVMSSTPARLWPSMRTIDERTNVAMVRWP